MRLRSAAALVLDVLLILLAEAAVFIYVLRNAGQSTGGIVAIVYTGLFGVVVVPVFEICFARLFRTSPGRLLLGLRRFA